MNKKILIVGGVAGGASTAARLRRLDENAEIIMFERDEYISFANCGLPYYIGGSIKERANLLVQTPKSMMSRFKIDVRINSEVIGIDTEKKTVKVKNLERGEYEESFDYLVLSPGAKALKPAIEGIQDERIFTLRNIPDTDLIKEFIDKTDDSIEGKEVQRAVVIGGGYVGVEMAENLREKGLSVTLVEAAEHILAPFDSDVSILLEGELKKNGINLVLGDGVNSFKGNEAAVDINLKSGKIIPADLIILAIGVTPDTAFIKNSGIDLGPRGHIMTNTNMETNIPGIYAVGDAVQVIDFISGKITAVPLAGPANKQGRIVADNIAGIKSTYKGTQGTSIIKVFNLAGANTGLNERSLKSLDIPYKAVFLHPASHATYYPGSTQITLKLIFGLDGKILGAQAVGNDGVDKRIDVIATVIRMGGTVTDLTELELSYAPPFSSAKDPVNMAGYIAENVLTGKMDVLTPAQYIEYDKSNTILLDVRTAMEFQRGHLEGAINIPVDSLRERHGELDPGKEIIEYCQVGLRGYIAATILSNHGYKVKNISGGYKSLSTMGF